MTSSAAATATRRPETPGSATWLPQWACPECRGPLVADGASQVVCGQCVLRFERGGDIYRFLTPERAAAAAPFHRRDILIRMHEGYGSSDPVYYRNLPSVPSADLQAREWRVRRKSYGHLRYHALRPMMRGPLRILDLGAGCGWLSHRLTGLGHHVVAIDDLADDMHGLGARRHYDPAFVAVQADFHALPLAPSQFDLAVFSGSLHCAPDPIAALAEAARVLTPAGVVVVMDSPVFGRERDGLTMVERRQRQLAVKLGLTSGAGRGCGFLTFATLDRAAALLGLSATFHRSRAPLTWRLRRRLSWLLFGGVPPATGIWVAHTGGNAARGIEA